jgi:subtilisin family serine protease
MRFLKFTFLHAIIAIFIAFSHPVSAQDIITPNLEERLSTSKSGEKIRINIRLADQYDTQLLNSKTAGVTSRDERREIVTNELKTFSKNSQKEVLSFLTGHEKSLQVEQVMPLWIVNLINCYATAEVIEQLAQMPGIARIDYDQERQLIELSDAQTPLAEADALDYNPNTAWNVDLVNAPQVWEQGFTGQDIIVAVLDTGVNANHQDLAGRMWTHPNYPNHGYNFVNNSYDTSDNQSHGTHCAGTVAGNGTAGTTTGMAPGATIMALKVLGDTGSGTEAGVWAAIQFSADYGAHIMSLSLGWQHSWNPDRSAWRTAMANAMEAGVIAAVAAGNEGGWGGAPPPANIRTPGDCPAPWSHPDQIAVGGNSAVVTVGSTTQSDAISSFSSKGPVTWQNIAPFNDYAYNPGTGLIIPDLVAPGSDILSLVHNNNSGYTVKSGTSMATPAVAGVMALMLSKNPALTPEQISQILEESAIPMSTSKSNTFGSGRLDALAAIEATPYMGIRFVDYTINDEEGNNDGNVNPGESILLGVTMENPTEEDISDVSVTISTESEFVTLLETTADLGDFEAGQMIEFDDIFSFEVSNMIPGNYEISFVLNATSPDSEDMWRSSFSVSAFAPKLEFLELIVDDSDLGNDNGRLDPGETAMVMIPIKNTGQLQSEDIAFEVQSSSPWIIFGSPTTVELSGLNPDQTTYAVFEITALFQTPLENIAELNYTAVSGFYEYDGVKDLVIGKAPMYTDGDIPSTYNTNVTTGSSAIDPGVLSVNVPEGAIITSVDVEYNITSQGGAWLSEQRSFLRVTTEGGTTESTVTPGPSQNSAGTHQYVRTGLDIANDVEPGQDIEFELHVFRTWGGSGSNTQYAFVPNNTWKVIVHYELAQRDVTLKVVNQLDEIVEDAIIEIYDEVKETDENGEVEFYLSAGSHVFNFSAYKHRTVENGVFTITDVNTVNEIRVERVFGVLFNVKHDDGELFEGASITLNGEAIEGYEVEELAGGLYNYEVNAEGYQTVSGAIFMTNNDIEIDVTMLAESGTNVNELTAGMVNLFPNPAQNQVTIEFLNHGSMDYNISLINHLGQTIRNFQTGAAEGHNQAELDLNGVDAGLYLIRIDNGTEVINKKLLVQ